MKALALALPIFVVLGGCEKAATILYPGTNPDRPVTKVTVYFSPRFKPGTFHAKLDGIDITNRFSPTPTPGGQSTADLNNLVLGFWGGEPVYRGGGGGDALKVSKGSGRSSGTKASVKAPPDRSGIGGSASKPSTTPKPPSHLAIYWHRIVVDGDCTGVICKGDELAFLPPHLVAVPSSLPLKMGVKHYLWVEGWPPASVPISVYVVPERPTIRLEGRPAGAGIFVNVPPGGRSSPIVVEGVVRGSQHRTSLYARGTQRALVSGRID